MVSMELKQHYWVKTRKGTVIMGNNLEDGNGVKFRNACT